MKHLIQPHSATREAQVAQESMADNFHPSTWSKMHQIKVAWTVARGGVVERETGQHPYIT